MRTIVDETIDIEIKRVLKNLDIEIEDHEEIPFDALEALKAYLGFKENNRNNTMLLHIFAYNYIFLSIKHEADDTIDDLKDITYSKFINMVDTKKNFLNHILTNYLKIIYYPNLYELVTDRLDLSLELTSLNKRKSIEIEFISDKLTKYLEELYFIYSNSQDINVTEVILHIIKYGDDPFNTYKKYFPNKDTFDAYKGLLIEMLYIHTYLYLERQKDMGYIRKDNKKILKDINKRITSNDLQTLPDDLEYAKLLLISFYYFDLNKEKFNKQKNKAIKKTTLNRVHPLLLYSVID